MKYQWQIMYSWPLTGLDQWQQMASDDKYGSGDSSHDKLYTWYTYYYY